MGRDDAPPAGDDDRTPARSADGSSEAPADVEELPVGGMIPAGEPAGRGGHAPDRRWSC